MKHATPSLFAIGVALIVALGGGCANGDIVEDEKPLEADATFEAWDGDEDGFLTEDEFADNITLFDSYDEDGDGFLTEEEFERGLFDTLDDDDNGVIDDEEFTDSVF